MNTQQRSIVEMSAAMIISGTIGWMVLASQRPVAEVVFWRCLFGTLCLCPLCLYRGYWPQPQLDKRQWCRMIGVGVAIVANWLLLFAAYTHTSIAVATVVYNTQPFMLVGLGMVFLGERPGWPRLGWLLLSFAGVWLIVQGRPASGNGDSYVYGVMLALAAAFFYAVAALLTKKLQGVPPVLISFIQTVVGTLLLLPFVLGATPIAAASWPWLITMGVVHTGLMYILLYGAIQRLPTHLTAALSFLYPLVALLADIWVFRFTPGNVQLLGGAAVLLSAAGMVLFQSKRN